MICVGEWMMDRREGVPLTVDDSMCAPWRGNGLNVGAVMGRPVMAHRWRLRQAVEREIIYGSHE